MKPRRQNRAKRKPAGKWLLWAGRLESRFQRRADRFRLLLTLHARIARTALLIEERWLHPTVVFRPELNLAIGGSPVSQLTQVFATQRGLLERVERIFAARPAMEPSIPEAHVTPSRRDIPPALATSSNLFHTSRTYSRQELASIVERRLAITTNITRRSEQSADVFTRLLHRSHRMEESSVVRNQMTLKRELTVQAEMGKASASRASAEGATERARAFPAAAQTPPTMPQINVDQLAEQVIRQIDRRVVARRERMGRI